MILGFDLDEVVVDLTTEIEKYVAINYGIEWPASCFFTYDFRQCNFHYDQQLNERVISDLFDKVHDLEFLSGAEPVEGAVAALNRLKKIGHKLHFISSRSKQEQPVTVKWLRKNSIPFDNVELIGHSEEKGVYGFKHQLDMYVDDLEKNLDSMWLHKKRWRKGLLLFNRPWNQSRIDGSKFKRVYNWEDILRHIGIQKR